MIALISGTSHVSLAESIADHLGVSLEISQTITYDDGEIGVQLDGSFQGQDVYIVQSLAVKPNTYLVELLLLIDAAKRLGAKKVTAIIPYLAYMRQDRVENHHAYSASVVAQVISQAVDAVILVEPHVQQISGFFTVPVYEVSTAHLIKQHIKMRTFDSLVLVSPDIGGMKRVEQVKPEQDTPIAMVEKVRTEDDVQMLQILGDIAGRDCVIIDDLVSSGHTLQKAAQRLKQQGANRVVAYVTHAVLPGAVSHILATSDIDALVTFDTVAGIPETFEKLSVGEDIGRLVQGLDAGGY